MSIETQTVIDRIMGRASSRSQLADAEDITAGVEASIGDLTSFSLFLRTDAAENVQIELSPDGSEWFEPGKASNTPAESPIKFDGAGTEVIRFGYDADAIRLTGANGANVTAKMKEVV